MLAAQLHAQRKRGSEFRSLLLQAFAERVVHAFSEPFALADGSVITTATVGVATTADSADVDELLRHADLALDAAKMAGNGSRRRYQPVLSAGMIRRREVQAALQEAVSNCGFTLVYQPIVALTSGEIARFQALVRRPHPQWGLCSRTSSSSWPRRPATLSPSAPGCSGRRRPEVVQSVGGAGGRIRRRRTSASTSRPARAATPALSTAYGASWPRPAWPLRR